MAGFNPVKKITKIMDDRKTQRDIKKYVERLGEAKKPKSVTGAFFDGLKKGVGEAASAVAKVVIKIKEVITMMSLRKIVAHKGLGRCIIRYVNRINNTVLLSDMNTKLWTKIEGSGIGSDVRMDSIVY